MTSRGLEVRFRRIIMGVVRELLRATEAPGVVVSEGGPEGLLLTRWLKEESVPVLAPSHAAVGLSREVLAAVERGGIEARPGYYSSPLSLAARALADREGLLLLGTATKTILLLSHSPPGEAVLPLGDVFASEILDLAGECTIPAVLGEVDIDTLRAVDVALQSYLEEGKSPQEALATVPEPLRKEVAAALDRARKGWHPHPLVPKLRACTMGIDLDL